MRQGVPESSEEDHLLRAARVAAAMRIFAGSNALLRLARENSQRKDQAGELRLRIGPPPGGTASKRIGCIPTAALRQVAVDWCKEHHNRLE